MNLQRIKKINQLIHSVEKDRETSNNYSLNAMESHVKEIRKLFLTGNSHWADETIDLLIHCLLFLERNGYDNEKVIEEILTKRCAKFEEKISEGKEVARLGNSGQLGV